MKKFCIVVFLFLFFIQSRTYSQTLIMNEVSNGVSGSQEYVEFVVVSNAVTYDCNSPIPPCIDIRGWIFDDNSGLHGTSGIAAGAIRFSFDPMWSCVPLGTIIVIYNDADPNTSLPTNDLLLSDGNCQIIAPISNTSLFEVNATTPAASSCSYPATGWTAGGNWTNTALANTSDCARIVNLAGCEVFSVCYGSTDNQNTIIYFSGSGSGTTYYFNNGDPFTQSNWASGSAASSQTPGLANNAANAAYIAQFNNGCTPITPILVTASSTNAGCTCNGTATATASGSVAGYTYSWYDAGYNAIGQNTAAATGLCAGVYNVIATSFIGCPDTAQVTITSLGTTTVSVNSVTICNGSSATLTATPSTGGGTYSWSPGGATTNTISVNPASTANYTVTYTLGGCSTSAISIVTVNNLPVVTVNSPAICTGASATLTAAGASTYSWNTGSTSNPLTVTPASTTSYTVTGTDANGCANTATSTITVNPLPVVTVNSATICVGVSTTLTATGATSYSWNTGSTSNPLIDNPVASTNYTVAGTDANGCVNTATSTITVNPLPVVTVNSATICAGANATLTAAGATSYSWNTGSTSNSLIDNPVASTNYTVTGTDANGCVNTAISTVTVNNLPVVTVNSATICVGANATLTAAGATSYSWNTGSTSNPLTETPVSTTNYTVTGTDVNGCVNTATSIITVNSLPNVTVNSPTICTSTSGTLVATGATNYLWSTGSTSNPLTVSPVSTTNYTVTGTDANGCVNTATSTVTVSSSLAIVINSPSVCIGQIATLNASGASAYTWSDGSTGATIFINPATTTSYTVTGTDGACNGTGTATVTVNPLPVVTVNSPAICEGTSATLTAAGAISYSWNTGSISNPLTDAPVSTTNYTVTGTDANGCVNTATSIITVNALPVIAVNSETICLGTSATLTATGATSYLWNGGSTSNLLTDAPASTTNYTVTGTDANGCVNIVTSTITVNDLPNITVNSETVCSGVSVTLTANGAPDYLWHTGATGNTLTDAPASTTTYTVAGTDANGCVNTATATITVNALPVISVSSQTICSGQTVSLTASGGLGYIWDTGETNNLINVSPGVTTIYTVTGVNANCSSSATATVTVIPAPTVIVNSTAICLGQQATLTANGATGYLWSTSETTTSISVSPSSTTSYTVVGTDAGCSTSSVGTITVNPLPAINIVPQTICEGQPATLNANGAATYIWDDGSTTPSINVTPLATTSYTVTGTDANGCINTTTTSVTVNPLPVISINANPSIICEGETTSLSATGATSYIWNTTESIPGIIVSPATTTSYSVVGTSNGCSSSATITITVTPLPAVIVNSPVICTGQSATLTASGATSYVWDSGSSSTFITESPISTTSYTVTGTTNGCSQSAISIVTVNSLPVITVASDTICSGQSATIIASGADSYLWNTGSISPSITINPTSNTTYTVTGTLNGCVNIALCPVVVNPVPNVTFNSDIKQGCAPVCVKFTDITSIPSGTVVGWNWNFGNHAPGATIHNPSNCFNDPGIYDVSLTVTSDKGCVKTYNYDNMITVFSLPEADFLTEATDGEMLVPNVQFINQSLNATTYTWNFGDSTSLPANNASTLLNPNHVYDLAGTYTITLIAKNNNGCIDIIEKPLVVNDIYTFYAPNAFSPNSDNTNETFLPLGTGWNKKTFKMNIFDRWGNMIFTTDDPDKGWDGKANNGNDIAQIDTYVWKVNLSDIFGQKHSYYGRISIIK
ncbi:MAG: PKD domain-containing protein [Bacteroidota bacterium]|nr:PKD domain-containing protein [Bacteroidota bacterium]